MNKLFLKKRAQGRGIALLPSYFRFVLASSIIETEIDENKKVVLSDVTIEYTST